MVFMANSLFFAQYIQKLKHTADRFRQEINQISRWKKKTNIIDWFCWENYFFPLNTSECLRGLFTHFCISFSLLLLLSICIHTDTSFGLLRTVYIHSCSIHRPFINANTTQIKRRWFIFHVKLTISRSKT